MAYVPRYISPGTQDLKIRISRRVLLALAPKPRFLWFEYQDFSLLPARLGSQAQAPGNEYQDFSSWPSCRGTYAQVRRVGISGFIVMAGLRYLSPRT